MAKKKKAVKAVAKKPAKKTVARKMAARRRTAPVSRAKSASSGKGTLLSVAAGFTVNDIEKSMAWYRDVLGFKVKERWERDGTLHGAEMSAGDVAFYLGQDDWKMGRDRVKGVGTRMYITTGPRIGRLADNIKARGGTLTQELREDWGMRTFSVEDPDGYRMTFMFPLKK